VLLREGRELPYTTYRKGERPPPVEDEKTLNARVDAALEKHQRQRAKPAPDHPWRQAGAMAAARTATSPAASRPRTVARRRLGVPPLCSTHSLAANRGHLYFGEKGTFLLWVDKHLLRTMADGFAKALAASAWTVPGALHQTRIYPEVVQKIGARVAWFFVDAMRFEMGVELARQIEGAKDLRVRAAVAALPSITPVGMAALLPGASASFNLVEAKGKLTMRIEGTDMKESGERMRFLKAKVPDAVEMTLGKLLGQSPAKVGKEIGTASLVVIPSQEIDYVGETDSDLLARQVMDTIIGNLARAARKLAAAGIEHFVITADHGHQFAIRKEDDMKTDSPGGVTLDLHRRCWIGHGGSTPVGTVRVAGAELGYQTDLAFIFPVGLGVFKAGGSLSFHHGGFSLQELVVPVVSLRLAAGKPAAIPGVQVRIAECPSAVTNRTFGLKLTAVGDLLATESIALRVLLMADAEEVGRAGMAIGGDFDRERGTLTLALGKEVGVGMILTNDACQSLRVVVLDAHTDSLLAQSDALPVKLGI
jgi:hypothetical protein